MNLGNDAVSLFFCDFNPILTKFTLLKNAGGCIKQFVLNIGFISDYTGLLVVKWGINPADNYIEKQDFELIFL